jgi:glycosyltransferase involved in cell wall biosynthesis
MNPLKISVIIPVFNTANYLHECLESCVNQTYENFEVIIVDDGSTDESRYVVNDFLHLPNFHYYYKDNGGLSSARNLGISLAQGDYFFFLDSDDYIVNNALAYLVNEIKETSVDYILSNVFFTLLRNNSIKITKLFNYESLNFTPDQFIEKIIISQARAWRATGCLYNANLIKEHNIHFPLGIISEDVFFNIKFLSKSKSMIVLENPILTVRKRRGSITATYNDNMLQVFLKLDQELRNYYNSRNDNGHYNRIIDELLTRNTIITIFKDTQHLKSFMTIIKRIKEIVSQPRIKIAIKNSRFIAHYHRTIWARIYFKLSFVLLKTHQIKVIAGFNFVLVIIKKLLNPMRK